ncbi:hypothetical protein [Klebsiella pneumoniae]|uniref:hypothetical protein n=1 Tax=Klebsiella pneumoniae TaxID=573 RepID=UPI00296252DD|nr:hypothetical protein [Klebsiella pneumoniae]MDW1257557.1 hypothetical protein [Klebsiella pneumoniae]
MNMNTLAIIIGIIFFLFIIAFITYSVVNIRKHKQLKDLYAKLLWAGIAIALVNAVSSSISADFHASMANLFVNYIKAMYYSVIAFGFFFILRSLYNRFKSLVQKLQNKSA